MTQSSNQALPGETHVGRTALTVGNLDEMTRFYRDVVGLAVLDRTDGTATLGTSGTPLLVLESDPEEPTRHSTATGLYHNAFRVPSRAALGDALERVRERWQLGGASDHLVSEALYLTDPEGNGVEIYRDRPREAWPRTPDGGVRMATDPLDLDAIAAESAGEETAPEGTDVGHVHLEVTDLDTFRAFWVDTVGFEETTTYPGASFVSAGGYHHHLAGNVWHHRSKEAGGRGLTWFELVLPDRDSLAAVRERLEAHGAALDPTHGAALDPTDEGFATTDDDGIGVRFRAEA